MGQPVSFDFDVRFDYGTSADIGFERYITGSEPLFILVPMERSVIWRINSVNTSGLGVYTIHGGDLMEAGKVSQVNEGYFCEYGYWHGAPNAETVAAIKEAEELLKDPNAKTFNSIDELMADIMSEDEDDDDVEV